MPYICFSYPADVPGTRNRNGALAALRDLRKMPYPCFSYQADVPRSMPYTCFSYSVDAPLGVRNRDAAQPSGLRRMPASTCFRY